MEPRLYQGQALRVCAVRPALTEPSLQAHPESGKVVTRLKAPTPITSGGGSGPGIIFKELPTNSADKVNLLQHILTEKVSHCNRFQALQ